MHNDDTSAVMASSNDPPAWVKGSSQFIAPTVFFMFGGGGLGAHGFQQAAVTLRGMMAKFRVIGGFDFDPYACGVFRYLTGVEEACADATTMTPADLRRIAGNEAPDCVVASAPCQGGSNLITDELAATDHYQAMNQLALVGTRLMLEAWKSRPPKFVFYENVPSLVRRAKPVIDEIFRILTDAGYEIVSGVHNARSDAGGAQNRKRWFMAARHREQVPFFLYRAPKLRGKVCGDVLGPLPMPGDPAAGPMHEMSEISALNWWRLWAIPAGQDWRALRKPDAGPTKRNGGNRGKVDLARAKPGFTSMDHVLGWGDAARTITGATRPGNGAPSVADPRAVNMAVTDSNFHHGEGPGRWGVLAQHDVSSTVIANARHSTGPFSLAAALPQPVDLQPREDCNPWCYGVLHSSQVSHVIAATSSVGCGPFSYAGAAPMQRYVVLTYEQAKAVADGHVQVPFSVIDPAHPDEPLAIVDNWERSPYRWEAVTTTTTHKRSGKVTTKVTHRKVAVPIVLISADGMWHRPLTTLELAVLQGLPHVHNGAPLNFGGGSTAQRKIVGNGIHSGVGKAFGEQVLLALVAAAQNAFYLDSGGSGVWVDRATQRRMKRAGIVVVSPQREPRYAASMMQ